MHELLQLATAALAANDAERLEALCREVAALDCTAVDTLALSQGMRSFNRQIKGARQNVILRERLFQMRCGEAAQWER